MTQMPLIIFSVIAIICALLLLLANRIKRLISVSKQRDISAAKVKELENLLKQERVKNTTVQTQYEATQQRLTEKEKDLATYLPIKNIEEEMAKRTLELKEVESVVSVQKQILDSYEIRNDLEEMSYYQPKFHLDSSLEYSDALELVRQAERELVSKKAVFVITGGDEVNREIGKLAVSAFNGDASAIVESVTYANYEKSMEKLRVAFNKVNNLLADTGLQIAPQFLKLKLQEMTLVTCPPKNDPRIS